MNILFENIRLLNPPESLDKHANLWILDGNIEYIGNEVKKNDATEVIDGSNLVCSPGLYDMHVHFREPGFSHKETIETGCAAAANGGFTGVMMMPNTKPAIDNIDIVNELKERAAGLLTDLDTSAAMTKGRQGKELSPMLELHEAGVKLFTDDGSFLKDADMMRKAFNYAATKDLMLSQHCEEHQLTRTASMNESDLSAKLGLIGMPNIAEEIAIARDFKLSEYCGNRRYHIQHMSTAGAVEQVREAKKKGLRVSAEVTPHHFTLTEDAVSSYDTNFKMNPPLRQRRDVEAIIEGLKDGTIDCIATDHAPHAQSEKEVPFAKAPFGITGLETALGVTLTRLHHQHKMELGKIIELMAVKPRELLGIDLVKIQENEKANLVIFDPNAEWVPEEKDFRSKSNNSPFIGVPMKGKQIYTINNNQIVKSSF
jgi:dihydroorotase